MITVTFSGPIASGKTTAINLAIDELTERGMTCRNIEDLILSRAAKARLTEDVVFTSMIGGEALSFTTDGACTEEIRGVCYAAMIFAVEKIAKEKAEREAAKAAPPAPTYPDGQYALVEQMGHQRYVGRVQEVDRFGAKLLQVEPIYQDKLLQPLLISGGSLYRFTECTAETAFAQQPDNDWQLPEPVRATLPRAIVVAISHQPSRAIDVDLLTPAQVDMMVRLREADAGDILMTYQEVVRDDAALISVDSLQRLELVSFDDINGVTIVLLTELGKSVDLDDYIRF